MEEKQPQQGKDDGEGKTPQTEGSCQHRDNIALLKMHKCSSSTLQNILFRFGEKHDLTFIMPPRGNYLGYPAPFEKRFAIQVPWNEYNIYTFHSRFSYRGISNMMPSDTIFITVIRDPVKMYESTFTYFRLGARYGLKGGTALRDFLQDAEGYFRSSANKQRIKNPMLYDLGLEANKMHDMSHIEKKIATLGDIFDLVLISEYFDESLILLKELMCWDLDDIVYFKLNARSSSSVRNVTPDMAKKLKHSMQVM
ncbi:galactosylceramide sulfotransferase-like [Ptychodera flava]|uniref:galactosylceramide sulfotransferase-like n=1 Tax=Ptychodera flava TaxID=63121 RepID=UPI00396A2F68